LIRVFKRGEAPLLKFFSPSPRLERGIKWVRLMKKLYRPAVCNESVSNI
jgi:hypothetical protein